MNECKNGYISDLLVEQKPVAYICISGISIAIYNKEQIPNNFIMFM